MIQRYLVLSIFIILGASNALAGEINLKNGDKVTGMVVEETDTTLSISTQAMGTIIVQKEFILREKEEESTKNSLKESVWSRKASFGYSQTGGNTEDSQGSAEFSLNRKTEKDEWSAKVKAYISTSNDQTDAKKFYGMGRYAFSYGKRRQWYNFYKIEGDQDIFSNIDYRLIPSTGIGYWFSDEEDFKLMLEGAFGFEHTNYHDRTKSKNEAVFIPRGFLEKSLMSDLKFSQDIILYPSLKNRGEYRLHSETALTNSINDSISWKLSFIDDFNKTPAGSAKKNDFRLVSSIDYEF